MKLLCNEVAPHTSQVKQIAINLDIQPAEIDKIYRSEVNESDIFLKVFETWRSRGNPPFTWSTIVKALKSQNVNEQTLANDICVKYSVPS